MIDRKDCEFYYQHYGYSSKDNWLHPVNCAHCKLKVKNKTCKDCPNFEPRLADEKEVISILNSFLNVEDHLKEIKRRIKKLKLK